MPNIRIISDNALDRAINFSATNTNVNYPASNMLNDDKSNTWRTNGTGFTTITATWATPETIAAVVFPFCGFSPAAIGKLRVSTELSTTNYVRSSDVYNGWIDNGSGTWVPNFGLAPNNTSTSTKVVVKSSGSTIGDRYHPIDGMPVGTMVYSMYAKAGTTSQLQFYVDFSAGGAAAVAVFDLITGAASITPSARTLAAKTTSVGNGWWRAEMTMAVPAGSLYLHCQVVGPLSTYAEVWGAQLEFATTASSFFPTTGAAAQRPAGYIDNWQFYSYDSGNVLLCPAPAIKLRGFTAAQSLVAYAYGGGACARMWFPQIAATGIRMDLDDGGAPGFLEIAKAIIAPYWSPSRTIADAPWTMVDLSSHYRTDAGSLMTDAGTVHKKIPINFGKLLPADRAVLAGILRNSRAYPIFVSVFPGVVDLELERDYSIYGKRSQDSEIAIQYAIAYSTTVELEGI
jgi:hypothetical protein